MEISLTTPALLFPAISLLLLAYTNRFLAIANIIRQLHRKYMDHPESILKGQLKNLRVRLYLIRIMQLAGVSSLLLCVVAMILIFFDYYDLGRITFGISLLAFFLSLLISLREIQLSTKALEIELSDMELGSKYKF